MDKFLDLLGLGTPFVYAMGVYGLFHYVDARLSVEARTAFYSWIHSVKAENKSISKAMIEVFDRVYTRPLLSWRAFLRSAIITIFVFGIFLFEYFRWTGNLGPFAYRLLALQISLLVSNIISDYISLFIVRRALQISSRRPILTLFVSATCGLAVVVLLSVARDIITLFYMGFGRSILHNFAQATLAYTQLQGSLNLLFTVPALAVHLWLVLLATALVMVNLLTYIASATDKMEWLIDGARDHPLDMLGYLAGAIVFVFGFAFKFFYWLARWP